MFFQCKAFIVTPILSYQLQASGKGDLSFPVVGKAWEKVELYPPYTVGIRQTSFFLWMF
jgi:hypothetical protein